jgi:Arc/MetJ-type ribon-helix-helix transcriptional regulator
MATTTRKHPTRLRGRPSKGIGEKYRQISLYLPPEMVEEVDVLADRRERRTGHHTNRTDLLRELIRKGLDVTTAEAQAARPRTTP